MDALRLGYVEGATPDRWARRWADQQDVPLVLVMVTEAEQAAALAAGDVDACLARLPLDPPDPDVPVLDAGEHHVVRLYDEQPVVVVPVDHVATAVEEVELADLADEQHVLPWASVPGFAEVARAPRLPFPPMTVREAVEVVASGTGVVVLPMSLARLHQRKDVAARPVVDGPVRTVALVWRRDREHPLVQDLVGIVRGRTARSSRGSGSGNGDEPARRASGPTPPARARSPRPAPSSRARTRRPGRRRA